MGPRDYEDLCALLGDPRVAATLAKVRSRAEVKEGLEDAMRHWEREGFGMWAFRDATDERFVGRAGLRRIDIDEERGVELAYALRHDGWGRGLCTEAVAEILRVGFGPFALDEIVAFTLPTNLASRRVLEKSGFVYARDFERAGLPHVLYRLTRDAWEAARRGTVACTMDREPFAARLHVIPRTVLPVQNAIVRALRGYFMRAPGWVLLTTTGRRTGLPREVLLPCERFRDGLIVLSTYGRRSNWIRNLEKSPEVRVTSGGWVLEARAEIVDDLEQKRGWVSRHPFFAPAPMAPFHLVLRTLLRPLLIALLRRWVTPRPVVVIRPTGLAASAPDDRDARA